MISRTCYTHETRRLTRRMVVGGDADVELILLLSLSLSLLLLLLLLLQVLRLFFTLLANSSELSTARAQAVGTNDRGVHP
jgi:hypothetical protein